MSRQQSKRGIGRRFKPIFIEKVTHMNVPFLILSFINKEFEDTKGVIRIRKSMKVRQHNGQEKRDKRTNNDLQNIHIKLKIE